VHGGAGNDTLNGGPGCDRVFGGADNDTLDGGPGFSFHRFRCERLFGGLGNDVSSGGPGRDFMSGGKGEDSQSGGPGADKIFANPGRDTSDGGDGNDMLWALARVDVSAIGDAEGDELSGGNGRDLFLVRDGEVDLVHCGEGHDRVVADQFDQVDNDCERVNRRDITSLDQVEDREENRFENPTLD
jgi:Ca2+-binding RTX toxin-like protein